MRNIEQLAIRFNNLFGLDLNEYTIPELKSMGMLVFDVIKLDDYLMEKHNDYVDGVSMQECVLKHYGEEGNALLMDLIDNII